MPDLRFQVEDAAATPNAATPQLSFTVRITNSESEPVHSIALRAQVQIEPVRRRYNATEHEHLKELFGEPERWSKSVHPLLWTNANVNVPGFTGSTVVEFPVDEVLIGSPGHTVGSLMIIPGRAPGGPAISMHRCIRFRVADLFW